jgi:histidyl-tRNA synthetase
VFVRSLGDETDVVQKEMYTFEDRGGRSLTLRPEGTAGVIRAIANRGLSPGEECRVFYGGPMFRGERPAAGRRRQFHQIGVEAVGSCYPLTDAECIAMLVHYLEEIGIPDGTVLINTRGLAADREQVASKLRDFFGPHVQGMCEDCQRRLNTNVWRILDCKNDACRALAETAPSMVDLICDESREFFSQVCRGLDELGVAYELAPRLVRGLDYYVHTVFEVIHSGLGAQDALAGGGRYQITLPGGKKPVDGVGFAVGLERLLMARESLGVNVQQRPEADVFIVNLGEEALFAGMRVAQELRRALPDLRVKNDLTGRSMKAQMRTANRIGARFTLIQGEDELRRNVVQCRDMMESDQAEIAANEITDHIRQAMNRVDG